MTSPKTLSLLCTGALLLSCKGGGDPIIEPPPPPPVCADPVAAVDTSNPTTVVGDGTPESCTEDALAQAIAGGGVITFDCGPSPHTITIREKLLITRDTIIDGGDLITLSGGGSTRILSVEGNFVEGDPSLTVQNLSFIDAQSAGTEVDDGGGAIFRRGLGSLTVINSKFFNNRCSEVGQDVAGGAVYSRGGDTTIVGSVFSGNACSNGGAIGNLGVNFTLVNSTLTQNSATGNGGNPGNGGNGGGIYIDGFGATTICGTTVADNTGNAFGGGIFRFAPENTEPTVIDRSTFDNNAIPNQDPSMAGGVYLQGTDITLTNSTISNNEATSVGGLFVGPLSRLTMINVTIAQNTAIESLGGGMAIDSSVSGVIRNCTLARNRAPGEFAFAGAISGGSQNVVLANTIIADNEAGNGFNPISCTARLQDGGGNIQFPVERAGAGSDDPDALCAEGALIADPGLGPLQDNGGPTRTIAPAPGGPADGLGEDCPKTDQRGATRGTPCTIGALEID